MERQRERDKKDREVKEIQRMECIKERREKESEKVRKRIEEEEQRNGQKRRDRICMQIVDKLELPFSTL